MVLPIEVLSSNAMVMVVVPVNLIEVKDQKSSTVLICYVRIHASLYIEFENILSYNLVLISCYTFPIILLLNKDLKSFLRSC